MQDEPAFLGTGWAFPPLFTAGGQDVEMVSGVEDIRQSLEILLATHVAERPFVDRFGCDLREFLYEDLDQGLINRLTNLVSNAILLNEPRIVLNGVDVEADDQQMATGRLLIRLDYTIPSTNSRYNLVFPFYLNEAAQPPT